MQEKKKSHSQSFKTIRDVYDYLDNLPAFQSSGMAAAKMGTERIQEFCDAIGNPESKCRFIHVAGTNGKGSVSAMLASVYAQAGYKTGLYTSPHLIHFRERIRVGGVPISEDEILSFFQQHRDTLERIPLTYFELMTALAYWYFAAVEADLVILETGLGGRYDATNIVRPLISVITSVGMDHTDYLGDTIGKIAREKAGIIKEKTPVIIGKLAPEALFEVKEEAKIKHAKLISIKGNVKRIDGGFQTEQGLFIPLPYAKDVQRYNIEMAELVTRQLAEYYTVTETQFGDGISKAFEILPGRMERMHSGYQWFFDGAHNTEAVQELKKHLKLLAPDSEKCIIFSVMSDKATPEFLKEWSQCEKLYYAELSNPRAAKFHVIKQHLPHCKMMPDSIENVSTFLSRQKTNLVIFTGSFYFYNTVRSWMTFAS